MTHASSHLSRHQRRHGVEVHRLKPTFRHAPRSRAIVVACMAAAFLCLLTVILHSL